MHASSPRRRLAALGTALTFAVTAALAAATSAPAQAAEPVPLITSGTTEWRYLDDNTDPAAGSADRTSWTTSEFDDAAWKTGTGSFGANQGTRNALSGGFVPDVLLNQYIDGTAYPDIPAYFFRTEVEVSAADLTGDRVLVGSVRYDDAATVYVNGTRIGGGDDAAITQNLQYGGSNASAPKLAELSVPASVLTAGTNVVAVEIHQGRATSSDVFFDLPSLTLEDVPPTPPTPLIESGTTQWRYLDDNTDPASGSAERTSWTTSEFDDSAWKAGAGSFGAVNGTPGPLSGGFTADVLLNQYIDGTAFPDIPAFFFRTEVEVTAAELEGDLVLQGSVRYDDSVTIYVNGQRIAGGHDEGITENLQYGGSNSSTPILLPFTAPASVLKAGTNVIAVEVHQGRATSSDVYFDLPVMDLGPAPEKVGPSSIILGVGTDETQRNLAWFSDTTADEVVQIARTADLVDGALPASAATIAASESGRATDGVNEFFHATLTDLLPETSYTYRVGADQKWSTLRTFTTHSNALDHDFTFVGDPQIGSSGNPTSDGQGWAASLAKAQELYPTSQFLLSAGDQVETASNANEYRILAAPEQVSQQANAWTLGNHDIGSPLFGQHFNLPNVWAGDSSGGTYWFKHNGVLHLNINSNSNDFANHERFLRETIEAEGDDAAWTVLTFHHSLFSVGPHSTSGSVAKRNGLAPIISSLDIDMVYAGHDHSYARSYLMNGLTPVVPEQAETNADGVEVVTPAEGEVLYVTGNSSSGSKYYTASNSDAPYVAKWDQSRTPTVANVEVTQCSITTTTNRVDNGAVIDAVELFKDEVAPALSAPEGTQVVVGEDFDPLAGLEVSDACDPAVTVESVTVTGEVDTDVTGTYTLTYTVVDASGNETVLERTVEVAPAPDTDAPVVTVIGPESVVEGEDATFSVSVADASEIASVERRVNGGGWVAVEAGSFTLTDLVAGSYDVEVRATDAAQNSGSKSVTLSVTAPPVDPEPSIVFDDIADNTFREQIEWLVGQKITTGYANADGTFSYRGSEPVLREQMAAFLYRFDHEGANPAVIDGPSRFSDVAPGHVFKAHIAWLAERGITTGYDDGTFRPGQPVLREQMAAFLYRLAGSPIVVLPETSPFADVPTTHTFYRQIVWLEGTGITTGYTERAGAPTFRGSEPVLREQMAAFLFRFSELPGSPTD
ncbi:S-layer homology domain-containing protein [Aeromicrobium alkaliterrae]|uniref:SLH domain-containing protein n=1 Tax=Aeromicrobium alkaliterrae TaxID=302168 RepID=A0ABN2K5K6_9ACTN